MGREAKTAPWKRFWSLSATKTPPTPSEANYGQRKPTSANSPFFLLPLFCLRRMVGAAPLPVQAFCRKCFRFVDSVFAVLPYTKRYGSSRSIPAELCTAQIPGLLVNPCCFVYSLIKGCLVLCLVVIWHGNRVTRGKDWYKSGAVAETSPGLLS